ncbi:MAG TPA: aminotransferase class I/II-fold pyridoxal phosphate-dependent enzyme [Terriglobales bacterium]|nr:aminotransferase class I/II-fold pyridoxal phosphate-dependent enzyme [Terriglobales bacterium]
MFISRRSFLRTVGIGTATGVAMQWPLRETSQAARVEPARATQPGGPVRLDSNENAYGPSAKTMAAMRIALDSANRYPFKQYDKLTSEIATFHGVKPAQVLLGCGSTEILRVAAAAFLGKGKQLVQALPTFETIEQYARSSGSEVVSVPLTKDFAHDLDGMLAHAGAMPSFVYICNPNNPTASITPRADLESFVAKLPASSYVLIDEAYHHFAGGPPSYVSFLDRPVSDERLIIMRTFSKVYGLAGMRLGYAIASPTLIERMRPFITGINVNGIVMPAALAAMHDTEAVADSVKKNANVRQEFFNQAASRHLTPIESHTNFVMMETHRPAREVIEHFRNNNVWIGRPFPAFPTHARVSFGTPDEMQAFWRVWDLAPFAKMTATQ